MCLSRYKRYLKRIADLKIVLHSIIAYWQTSWLSILLVENNMGYFIVLFNSVLWYFVLYCNVIFIDLHCFLHVQEDVIQMHTFSCTKLSSKWDNWVSPLWSSHPYISHSAHIKKNPWAWYNINAMDHLRKDRDWAIHTYIIWFCKPADTYNIFK